MSQDERIARMKFSSVYPLYLAKVEKKGRTKEELDQVIQWLTGFNQKQLSDALKAEWTFETLFQRATLHANAHLITGVICGYRVEEIENPLTQQVRYLDKLVDELAKGRKMEKVPKAGRRQRAMEAERETIDRYVAAYLAAHVGEVMPALPRP